MNISKKYLLMVKDHKSEGNDKNSYKLVLRGGNIDSLRKGLLSFIRNEIELMIKES